MTQVAPEIQIRIHRPVDDGQNNDNPPLSVTHDEKTNSFHDSPLRDVSNSTAYESRAAYIQSCRTQLMPFNYDSEETVLSPTDLSPLQLLKSKQHKKSGFNKKAKEDNEIRLEILDHSPAKNILLPEGQCPICFCDYDEVKLVRPLSCKHDFCSDCLHAYILRQIDEFRVLKIKCPQDECNVLFNDHQIQDALTRDEYIIYTNKKLLKLRNQDPNLKYCPKPGCTKHFYPDLKRKSTKCGCGTVICHGCFHPKHKGKSCAEANAGEYELYAQGTDIKKCFVCKTIVDRNEGCAHMTCPVCDYEWCWDCGREWDPGHGNNCTSRWSPLPPNALKMEQQKNIIDQSINGIFMMFEIFFFVLSTALGVVFIWPCEMSVEIGRVLQAKIKNTKLVRVLSIFLAVISWIPAILFYPFIVVFEEYGGICFRRKKRWLKGTSTRFGFRRLSKNLGRQEEVPVAPVNAGGNHQDIPKHSSREEGIVQDVLSKNIKKDLHTDIYVNRGAEVFLGVNGN